MGPSLLLVKPPDRERGSREEENIERLLAGARGLGPDKVLSSLI